MLKCVNAWQCLRRVQLERVGVGVPGDGGPQNALSSPMFLWLSVSSLLEFLFLVLLLTMTVTIFGFLHLCSMQCKDRHVYVCKMCLSVELSVECMVLKLTLHFLWYKVIWKNTGIWNFHQIIWTAIFRRNESCKNFVGECICIENINRKKYSEDVFFCVKYF